MKPIAFALLLLPSLALAGSYKKIEQSTQTLDADYSGPSARFITRCTKGKIETVFALEDVTETHCRVTERQQRCVKQEKGHDCAGWKLVKKEKLIYSGQIGAVGKSDCELHIDNLMWKLQKRGNACRQEIPAQ